MVNFKHLFDNGKIIHTSSCYGNNDLEVVERTEDGESIRLLLVNGTRESATYTEKTHRNDLVFRYSIGFNDVFEINRNLKSCLLLGGAGFSYPKYFISRFPDKTLDVVEIDVEMVNIAYDVIFNDAYISDLPAEGLMSYEALSVIKSRLNKDGIYVANMITAMAGESAYPLFSLLAYLKQIFKYTRFCKCRNDIPANEKQNCLIFASDSPI